MHNCSSRNRCLAATGLTLNQVASWEIVVLLMPANWANEPIRPTQFEQALSAGNFSPEASLELHQRHLFIALSTHATLRGELGKTIPFFGLNSIIILTDYNS